MVRQFTAVGVALVVAMGMVALPARSESIEHRPKYLGTVWQGIAPAAWRPGPLLGTLFNQVTPENCGKWGVVEAERGKRTWTNLDAMTRFAQTHRMAVKYHAIVWGMQQPKWTQTAEGMKEVVDGWMADIFKRHGKHMDMIDAVNEPLSQPPGYRDQLGGGGASIAPERHYGARSR